VVIVCSVPFNTKRTAILPTEYVNRFCVVFRIKFFPEQTLSFIMNKHCMFSVIKDLNFNGLLILILCFEMLIAFYVLQINFKYCS
jgi:hypothetical protein